MGRSNLIVFAEDGRHFVGLHPHAEDLHLIIDATENLEFPVRPISTEVPRPVQDVLRIIPEGVLEEAGLVFSIRPDIAERPERSTDDDLALLGDAGRKTR